MKFTTFKDAVIIALIPSLFYPIINIVSSFTHDSISVEPVLGCFVSMFFASVWLGAKAPKYSLFWTLFLCLIFLPFVLYFTKFGTSSWFWKILRWRLEGCLLIGFYGGIVGWIIKIIITGAKKIFKKRIETKSGDF